MLRIVLLVAAVLVLVWLLRGIGRGKDEKPPETRSRTNKKLDAPDVMVACAHCGVHLPSTEAVQAQGLHFCGEPHRLEFERQRTPR